MTLAYCLEINACTRWTNTSLSFEQTESSKIMSENPLLIWLCVGEPHPNRSLYKKRAVESWVAGTIVRSQSIYRAGRFNPASRHRAPGFMPARSHFWFIAIAPAMKNTWKHGMPAGRSLTKSRIRRGDQLRDEERSNVFKKALPIWNLQTGSLTATQANKQTPKSTTKQRLAFLLASKLDQPNKNQNRNSAMFMGVVYVRI